MLLTPLLIRYAGHLTNELVKMGDLLANRETPRYIDRDHIFRKIDSLYMTYYNCLCNLVKDF